MRHLARCFCLCVCLLFCRQASAAPTRVVALSWESAEQLLELGVTPIAVADAGDYQRWVVRPALPGKVLNAGSRLEPNLELLAELKPDLIIISPTLSDLHPRLSRIAPVLLLDSYRADHDNALVARQQFLQLAERFGRERQARVRLAAMDRRFAQLRRQLHAHYGDRLPGVAVIRFANPAVLYLYGDNSMPQYALKQLGISPLWPQAATTWGVTQKKVASLGRLPPGSVLYLEPFDASEKLFNTPLWRAMPFVRNRQFAAVRSTWTYGGVASLQYLAEALSEALLSLPRPATSP
ncbi:iron-siderophore ABC transporter substrate-binding protein [Paludibacterium paludis]|uniref:Iron-hydroxamate ABC transporter substrate-binding protein n=1 Tax=Paludibacterium paludis TaxID=1225769 RepID=A0A918P416_9NEIS|nr:iron-siderophore ABC transporter substrate-binding protein [Paludibacterium paludis]GGY20137.1 iron-hydroxamate ABC transporter substrate-binding protein [Paludibacterium paludis]